MDSRWLGVIVLIIILGVGGWYVFSHPVTPAPVTEETPIVTESATTTEEAIPAGPVTVGYTGTIPFDACESVGPGESYSFTFTKADTWKYHDHVHATMFGTVVVTATPATTVTASTSVNVR